MKIYTERRTKMKFKTRKALLEEAVRLNAKDITYTDLSDDFINKGVTTYGLSFGVYGMNAGIFEIDGKFYVIFSRSSNLFRLV